MNILDIKYCAQDLRFEEDAYKKFETYEGQLKVYFLTQPDGHEIFEDLKLRICEMLQSKMKLSGHAISEADIADIKKSIGEVNQLEDNEMETDDAEPQPRLTDKKLYRDQNEKVIAGVCGGLGNYFSIDPLAFRVLFVLVVLMSKGFGLLVYLVLWIVLKPKPLPTNLSKRLFRNKGDKVIAGVCGGLASFFKTESWIVRLIFLSPIILNITMDGFFDVGFTIFNGSAMGFAIIAYIVLWITTKESETPTEELLSRGEDININSVSEETARVHTHPNSNSGLNNLLRVFAFIIIGLAMIPIVGFLIALVFGAVFMMPLTSAVLHTSLLKWLGALSILFFIVWPLVAFIVWGIRRMAGIKGPNTMLRVTFGGLWALGLASAITLSALLLGEMNKKTYVENTITLPVQGDTLFVHKLDDNFLTDNTVHTKSIIANFYEQEGNEQLSRLVSYKKRTSPNDSFYVKTRITALGKGTYGATSNAKVASYRTEFSNDQLFLSRYLSIPNNQPYRFQHAEVIIYVPKGKKAIIDQGLNAYEFGDNQIRVHTNDWDDVQASDRSEVEQDIEEAMQEVSDAIKEVSDEIDNVANEIEAVDVTVDKKPKKELDEIKRAEEISRNKIRIEKQKLKLKKEQLKLEQLQRELEGQRSTD